MPIYTYRREDGSTFELRQKFTDEKLQIDPETGQKVQRVIQSAGVIFKGSGFYVTDTRGANNPAKPKNGEASASASNGSNGSNGTNGTNGSTSEKTSSEKSSSSVSSGSSAPSAAAD